MSKTKDEGNTENANTNDNEEINNEEVQFTDTEEGDYEEGMSEEEIESLANKFIAKKKDALLEVAKDYPKKKSLIVDYSELFKFSPKLCDELIDFPDKVIRIFEKVVNEQDIPVSFTEVKFHVRFTLPKGFTVNIRDITSEYINKFFCTDGVVTRVSDVLPKVYVGVFQCPICGNRKEVYQEKDRKLVVPTMCDYCKKAVKFKLLLEECKFVDIQRLEIQEPLEVLKGGEEARKIEVWLTDDLTGKVLPGNTIEVSGIMKLIPPKDIKDAVYRKFIDANNINVIDREFTEVDLSEDDIKKIKEFAKSPNIAEKFINSISPTIYGYKEIKEAIALQLFGGSKFELPDKTKTRGEIHLLLIGDPGVAKSKLLMGASNIAPKSIYVSGKGTSAAGLTATAEKDEFAEGAWVLKAGALVLASGGIACLHPETNIIINNQIRSIGEIFNDAVAYKAQNTNDNEIVEINDITAYVPAFDFSDLSVNEEKAVALRKKKYTGKIIDIKFESGFSIKLTPDHQIINGSTLEWTPAGELSVGDFVLSPLKLPDNPKRIYILDIIPDEWKVILDKKEKDELKEIVLKKYKSLAEFNAKFNLDRHILSGDSHFSTGSFKKVIHELGIYDKWKEIPLHYARRSKHDFMKTAYLTPELGYILGFIYGDGSVFVNKRRTKIQVVQSIKHKEYISKFKECWKSVFGKEPNIHKRTSHSVIRKKDVTSENIIMYEGSILLGELYEKFVGKKLQNILLLPDDVLKSFVAGVMDADGSISIKEVVKNGKLYKSVDVEFSLSNDTRANLNFMIALRRFDCYSKLIDTKSNVQHIRITGRKDVLRLKDAIKKYSIKARKEIPDIIHNVSGTSDKLPSDIVSEISKDLCKINKTKLVSAGVWSTIYAYKEKKYLPSRDQLKKILERLNDEINPELTDAIELLMHRDFFLDKVKSINEYDFDGFVYDMYVPKVNNFVAEGIFVHNCVDEFDKMEKEDRAAMHEALEQQTISIAKAGIVAKFKAETCVLAAANPKFGRFSSERAITDQFDIPPALLSRFDLIFPIKDIMDDTQNQGVARYVLKAYSGKSEEELSPPIDVEFIRKYIAYARKNINPVVGEDAQKQIEEYYLRLRRESNQDIVQITARQLEGIIRLSCASAKMRLKNVVEKEDVDRAIRLMEYSLNLIAKDKETGKIDIDRVAYGPKEKRDKVKVLSEILEYLTENGKRHCLIEDFVKQAKEQGIDEKDAKNFIENAKREGRIFEPKDGEIGMIE